MSIFSSAKKVFNMVKSGIDGMSSRVNSGMSPDVDSSVDSDMDSGHECFQLCSIRRTGV